MPDFRGSFTKEEENDDDDDKKKQLFGNQVSDENCSHPGHLAQSCR